MTRRSILMAITILLCVVTAIVCSAAHVAVNDPRSSPVEVRTKDFLKTVTVIGELGCPIGTEVEVIGYCETDQNDVGWPDKLHLFRLNGSELKPEVMIRISLVKPAWPHHEPMRIEDGDIVRLKGFESGYFTGLPLPKGLDPKIPHALPANCALCYESTFEYLSAEQLQDSKIREAVRKLIAEKHKAGKKVLETAPGKGRQGVGSNPVRHGICAFGGMALSDANMTGCSDGWQEAAS
jgi:hypothetical protein